MAGRSPRGAAWAAAPIWLRVLCVLGIPWFFAWMSWGSSYLFRAGPGLPLMLVGCLGVLPWVLVATRARV